MKAIHKTALLPGAFLATALAVSSAQADTAFASAEMCLDHVHELENQSLSAELNAEQFDLLIELLVSATDLCRADALVDAQQELSNAADIIKTNS
jgi:hypothetical protein